MNETQRRDLDEWEAEMSAGWPHRLPGHKRQPCLVALAVIVLISLALWAVLAGLAWLAWDLARTWP